MILRDLLLCGVNQLVDLVMVVDYTVVAVMVYTGCPGP